MDLNKLSKAAAIASLKQESRELAKLERDLLYFLIAATGKDEMIVNAVIHAIAAIKTRLTQSERVKDLDFDLRTERLIEALYACGIPRWVAVRNAKAFMVLRPDFDLDKPRYKRIRQLLEFHADQFLEAYWDIARSHGGEKADQWVQYIRKNDIFFARIAQLPDTDLGYLFGG